MVDPKNIAASFYVEMLADCLKYAHRVPSEWLNVDDRAKLRVYKSRLIAMDAERALRQFNIYKDGEGLELLAASPRITEDMRRSVYFILHPTPEAGKGHLTSRCNPVDSEDIRGYARWINDISQRKPIVDDDSSFGLVVKAYEEG